jgi:hypothetical protein
MKYLLLLFSFTFYGQVLNHQMISSQGQTIATPSGLVIKQTVGQQSITGNTKSKEVAVLQGFQQSLWSKYITENKIDVVSGITTLTYPNPFIETINFQFSIPIKDEISILIFDVLGRLIFQQKKRADNTVLTLDLARLPTSEFLVQLTANNFNYYTKIIKQ